MKTSMPRQVLIFKKSLCFPSKPCLLNKCITFVGIVVNQESLRGPGRKRRFLVPSAQPGIVDFVGWDGMEGTVCIWEELSKMAPAPSLGRNQRAGLTLAPKTPGPWAGYPGAGPEG